MLHLPSSNRGVALRQRGRSAKHSRLLNEWNRRALRLEWLEPRTLLSTYYANNTSDSPVGVTNDLPLRAAIILANAHPGADTIVLKAGTYGLTLFSASGASDLNDTSAIGDLDVTDPLTIIGAGRDATVINGNQRDRVFQNFSTLTLENLTISGGRVVSQITPPEKGGGGILSSGPLTLKNCRVTGNTSGEYLLAHYGGGICATAPLALYNTIISNNVGSLMGGAVYSSCAYGTNVISGCTISSNSATWHSDYPYEHSVAATDGTWLVSNSTFSGNTGGLYLKNGTLTITDSTLANNGTVNSGSAVLFGSGTASIVGCTISGNHSYYTGGGGGGAIAAGSTLTIKNSIVAGNTSGFNGITDGQPPPPARPDIVGSVVSHGNNLIGNGTGSSGLTNGVNGDLVGTSASPIDPKLGSLQNNGGATLTMALLAGSPAIDAGNNAGAPATDQRGITRILDGDKDGTAVIDIGAYEFDAGPAISRVVVAEATAPKNGVLESNEKLAMSWAVASSSAVKSQSLAIDGYAMTPINGPYGGLYYSCAIGTWAVGTHTYVLQSTNANGASARSSGTFTVAAPLPPVIAGVLVAEAAAPKNGKLESNEKLKITWAASSSSGIASQTVTVDGKTMTPINGPYGGLYYSCVVGTLSAGSHTYKIKSTDSRGVAATSTGTFTVVSPPPPTIAGIVVAEAGTVKNGILEPNEPLKITWAASSTNGIASQTVTVDGKAITPINGPYGGLYYSCTIGIWAAGVHSYAITTRDSKGATSTSSGSFTVVSPSPPSIASVVVAEAGTIKNGTLEPNEPLKITWAASGANSIASQTVTVDGKSIAPINGPYSGLYYSCAIGGYSSGTHSYVIKSTDAKGSSTSASGTFAVAATLVLTASAAPSEPANGLSDAQLGPIVGEAISRWQKQLGNRAETALAGVKVEVADLARMTLGEALGKTIWIDSNAAGYGWFVDPTPDDDAEYLPQPDSKALAACEGSAVNRLDLLTTVMHEMGHVLGYDDELSEGVMNGTLSPGVRQTAVDAVFAKLNRA
jgi:hypothetical protein